MLDNIQLNVDKKEAEKAEVIQCAIDAASAMMRKAYEEKAGEIEQSIEQLKIQLVKSRSEVKVGTVCLRAKELLNNPVDTWVNGDLKTRQIIQNLVFNGSIFFSKKKIRVNAISPGLIRTRLAKNFKKHPYFNRILLNRIGETKEIADVVDFLLSEKSSYVNGQVLNVDGGMFLK